MSDTDSETGLPPLPKKKALAPKEKDKKRKKKEDGKVVPLPPIDGMDVDPDSVAIDPNKPMVDGMRHFGIGKNGMQRAIVKFQKPPTHYPYSVCFQFPNTFVTHRYVLDLIKEKIHFVPGGGVTEIQFVDRNVMHGTQGLDNRWVVQLSSVEARDELMRLGLVMFNKKIPLRRYDEVLQEEYKEFQDWVHLQKKMYAKLHGLPCSDDSDEDKDKEKEEDSDDEGKKKGKKKKKKKGKHKDDDKHEKKDKKGTEGDKEKKATKPVAMEEDEEDEVFQ